MSKRERLEIEIANIQKKMAEASQETPVNIKKAWEQELVNMEIELNNLVDGEEDNND